MRRPSRVLQWSSHRSVKMTVAVVILAATGVAASGATPAIGWQLAKPTLAYSCAFPSGKQPVSVKVAATFPATATAGQPIQPTGAGISVTLPRSVVSALGSMSAAMVRLSAALDVRVTENKTSVSAPWAGFGSPITPITGGNRDVTAVGTAPAVTVKTAGDATFTAAGLSLLLRMYQTTGQPTRPASVLVECGLKNGQDASLATIPVLGSGNSSSPGGITVGLPHPSHTRAGGKPAATYTCPGIPPTGFQLNPTLPPPPVPPKKAKLATQSEEICAKVVGFSNVRKLHESALIGPGFASITVGVKIYYIEPTKCLNHKPHPNCTRKENYFLALNAGRLQDHGRNEFPPATATLLAFGFMPVTATLQLTVLGNLNAYALGPALPSGCPTKNIKCQTTVTTLYSRVTLRIYDVKINGVPFDVGPACESVNPFVIKATGQTPTYSVQSGGELVGTATIPAFTGCGVGENLDNIFTASVSGPGNDLLLTQGTPCFEVGQSNCPPCTPPPQRTVGKVPPLCTGTPGDTQSTGRLNGN